MRVEPAVSGVRASDHIVADVAAGSGGRYDIDLHLRHDPSATEAFAEAHIRRLEAIRKLTGGVTREADGSWIIAPDRPVMVETLSLRPLEYLVGADAATWLDRELISGEPTPLRDAGFGSDVREALVRRRQWLVAQGLIQEMGGLASYPPEMIGVLRGRELLRIGAQLSNELGMPFAEAAQGGQVRGIYRRQVDLLSRRYALIEKSREFTLVPWRPVLERHLGKSVSGIVRGDEISWSFGRGRTGPSIS